jgi:paired small multidrug resistance pump
MISIPDMLGYLGVLMVLVAYTLQQARRIEGNGLVYPSINLLGALLILASLMYKPNMPAIVMEAAWVIVSVVAIIFVLKAKNKTNTD